MNPESTVELLQRVKQGDQDAFDCLLGRYVAPLRRWAHGRLPRWATDQLDTQDLVQDALLTALRHLEGLEAVGPAALHSYLRQAVMNRVRDELGRANRHPVALDLDDPMPDASPSLLEKAIGKEALDAYKTALLQLNEEDRELIVARVEYGFSYDEMAAIFDKPSVDAARIAVREALIKLAGLMPPDVMRIAR